MTDLYVENKIGAPALIQKGSYLGHFHILDMMAVGGFGQVYQAVIDGAPHHRVVIKVESTSAKLQLLYNETSCLKSLNQVYNPNGKTCCAPFLKYYGYGATSGIRYLAMEQCGENLRDLKKDTPADRFSIPTSLWILHGMISSLEKMHNIGWLHRDVKPANFCVGSHSKDRSLFVLDFGMSKCYVEEDGTLKARQISAPFHGTLRYVSVNIHRRQDASRWDDIWSAFYIAIENMVGFLPWRRLNDVKKVGDTKLSFDLTSLKYGKEVYQPKSISLFHSYLKCSMSNDSFFYTPPPYRQILQNIEADLALRKCSMDSLVLDWMAGKASRIGSAHPTPKKHHQHLHQQHQDQGDRSVRFY